MQLLSVAFAAWNFPAWHATMQAQIEMTDVTRAKGGLTTGVMLG
jgi:hypothetical protein